MEYTVFEWNGFSALRFDFEGHEAVLVQPQQAAKGNPWLLKTEYFGAFPDLEIEMLRRGWHLAYVKNGNRWGLREDLDRKKRLRDYLVAEFGLSAKCVPVGMSCGGLIGSKFAAKYPECVSALYLDAPVMNLLSCPAGLGVHGGGSFMQEFVDATGMDLPKLICYREHPIDKMHLLLQNNIPIILVYGDADVVVSYTENGALLEKYYKENGGVIEVYGKAGCGHHPHGLEDNTPIIEFVEKYSI